VGAIRKEEEEEEEESKLTLKIAVQGILKCNSGRCSFLHRFYLYTYM
jgi:hypothetical protein